MRRRSVAPLIILLFLVIGLGILWIFRSEGGLIVRNEEQEAFTPTPVPTATPEPTATPSPTAEVSHEASGSFLSDSGTWLNVLVRWESFSDTDGKTKLKLDIYAQSYSLHTGQRSDDIVINVGGTTYYATSVAVTSDVDTLTETYLASKTVEITPNVDVPVTVTWYFNGTYSNQQLTTITASSTLHVPG